MQRQFYVGRNFIPEELRCLYEEVSENFERRVFGALKTKESDNEKTRRVPKKFLVKREIHAAIPGGKGAT